MAGKKAAGTAKQGERAHKATYARDKRKGGYLIRVQGPHAASFAGREVPVTRKDDSESMEKLDAMIWSGTDTDSGKPVALYSFVAKPKDESDEDEVTF